MCRKPVSFWKLKCYFLTQSCCMSSEDFSIIWSTFMMLSLFFWTTTTPTLSMPWFLAYFPHADVWVCSRWRAQSSSAVRRRWMSTSPVSSSPYTPMPSTSWTPPACWRSEDNTCRRRTEMGTERRPSGPDMHRVETKTWTTSTTVSGASMMRTCQWKP